LHCPGGAGRLPEHGDHQRETTMSEVTSYAPGTPSWVDLMTSDPEGARGFYGELFGWDYEIGRPRPVTTR
jgi:hypothetical protein